MTIQTLLKQSGVKYHRNDAGRIGILIMKKAKEDGVLWTKKQELIEVNDFPETFIEKMQDIAIQYFKTKK